MNNTKSLTLAAFTALSLGFGSLGLGALSIGTAMAQSEIPSAAEWIYFSGQPQVAPVVSAHTSAQSGSSDADIERGAVAPFDYGTLANPG